ncbi:MAG: hypothetical protein IJ317_05395 [Clostridia bacterium]|nr:hypothetical protein [Clostridia bacterium]
MKLEKREITLNEYDSLQDAFYLQKLLINEYVHALAQTSRKETRSELMRLVKETCEDMCFVADLMNGSAIENKN